MRWDTSPQVCRREHILQRGAGIVGVGRNSAHEILAQPIARNLRRLTCLLALFP
jgi:hypothetical protein